MAQFLVTGAAGFIGFHVSRRLLERGETVVGLDNLCSYYDVQLKRDRLSQLADNTDFTFSATDLADRQSMESVFSSIPFDAVIHLAFKPHTPRGADFAQPPIDRFENELENILIDSG